MTSSAPLPSRNASMQQPLIPDDLIDPTRAAALRFSRFPAVDAAVRSLAVAIVDQYITRAWLDKLTLNRDMPRAVLTALAHASRQLEERLLLIPWHSVLLVDLPTLLGNHYAAFAGARAAVAVSSSTVLHQPTPMAQPALAKRGSGKGPGARTVQASGTPLHGTTLSVPASNTSVPSNRPIPSQSVPTASRFNAPPQYTAESGSSASLAPDIISPSTPTQPTSPPFPPKTAPSDAPALGWPTASTPVDQFTPTDAKFALLMPHVALEPLLEPSSDTASTSSLPCPPTTSLPAFNDYLRTVASILLDAFLPTSTLVAEAERLLMRDIVAGVLGMVIEAMSDPVMLLTAITAAFEASSTSRSSAADTSSASISGQQPESSPPRSTSSVPPSPHSSTIASQQESTGSPPPSTPFAFSSSTLSAHWSRVLAGSQWTWYQATLLWHTLLQRLGASSAPTLRSPAAATTVSPWVRSSARGPRHLVHQADTLLFTTLDHVLHLTHNPATRPWTLLWHLWLRPPIRFLFGTWLDTYLHVAVLYPWNAQLVARMVHWVTDNVVLKPRNSSTPPAGGTDERTRAPDMHQLLVQSVDAIVLATGTPALRPVLTDHTLRALASRYRNRQLVVRVVDVLVAQVVAAGARVAAGANATAARAAGAAGNSPGADALLLTGRRRGPGVARTGATSVGRHGHHHSVSASVVSGAGATLGGIRRASDVGATTSNLGTGALLAASATATATATSVVASMATSSSAAAAAAAMRHRRSRSTGGASNLGRGVASPTAVSATSSPTRASGPVPSSAVGRRQSITAELVYREAGPVPPIPPLPRAASVGPLGSTGAGGGSPRVLAGDRRRRS